MIPVYKNAQERYMAKIYCPVSLSVVSRIFEKPVDHCK